MIDRIYKVEGDLISNVRTPVGFSVGYEGVLGGLERRE